MTAPRSLAAMAALIAFCAFGAIAFAQGDGDDSAAFFGEAPAAPDDPDDFFGDAPAAGPVSAGVLSGEAWQKAAVDTARDGEDEFIYALLTLVRAQGDFTFGDLAARISGIVTYDAAFNEDAYDAHYTPELWEAYARWRVGPVDLTAGQKIWSWGKTDIVSPTDLINPYNFDRYFDAEIGLARLPVMTLDATWYAGAFQVEGLVIPFLRPTRLTVAGDAGAVLGQRFPLGDILAPVEDEPAYRNLKRFLDLWIPDWKDELTDELSKQSYFDARTENPDDDFSRAGGAVRAGASAGGFDFDVMGYSVYDPIPTVHINPDLLEIARAFERTPEGYGPLPDRVEEIPTAAVTDPFRVVHHRLYGPGADVATTVGAFAIRAEGTALWGRHVYREDLTTVEKPTYSTAINVEYMFPGDTTVSATFWNSTVGDADGEDLLFPPTTAMLFLGWRAAFFRDRLQLQGVATYNFSHITGEMARDGDVFGEDGQFTPIVEWSVTDPFHIGAGANVFFGERDTLWGLLRDRSRVFAFVAYHF
ncbi:hypothetical protein K8I61_17900 [bacterium]|nr:hypothetical protein [bacterium]